jgi:hypothetical protein
MTLIRLPRYTIVLGCVTTMACGSSNGTQGDGASSASDGSSAGADGSQADAASGTEGGAVASSASVLQYHRNATTSTR